MLSSRTSAVKATRNKTFNLPTGVQQDKIMAVFKDGVLEVTMPKAEKAKPNQVKIDVK